LTTKTITPANVGVGPERMKATIKDLRKKYGQMLKRPKVTVHDSLLPRKSIC
jgi:hypothetical protein